MEKTCLNYSNFLRISYVNSETLHVVKFSCISLFDCKNNVCDAADQLLTMSTC